MAKTQLGSNAQFTGAGLGLSHVSDWVYAYSGLIGATNSETTLLSFSTGKGLIVAKVQFGYVTNSVDVYRYRIKFNGVVIQAYHVAGAQVYTEPDNVVHLIIPPLTTVEMTAQNQSDTSSNDMIVSLTGRHYKA